MEYVKLDKSNIDQVLAVLQMTNIRCNYCKEIITKDNFGVVHADVQTCNDLICLYQGIHKIEG